MTSLLMIYVIALSAILNYCQTGYYHKGYQYDHYQNSLPILFPFPFHQISNLISNNHGIQSSIPCRPPFGCFPTNIHFYSSRRPFNPPPKSIKSIQTKFFIYYRAATIATDNGTKNQNSDYSPMCSEEPYGLRKYDLFSSSSTQDDNLNYHFRPCVINTDDLLNRTRLLNNFNQLKSFQKHQEIHNQMKKNFAEKKHHLDHNFLEAEQNEWWTAVIIHGFNTNSTRSRYPYLMRNLFLSNPIGRQYRLVIIVDWELGSMVQYPQACSNARLVATQTAFLLRELNNFSDIHLDRIHLIGHSLGAHLAGYVGKNFTLSGQQIGRITGLDPAGPFFDRLSPLVRLDRNDARFVDVIHTHARSWRPYFSLGISHSIGHMDFYPNGGYNQPGCQGQKWDRPYTEDDFVLHFGHNRFLNHLNPFMKNRKFLRGVVCDHSRAVRLFIASIPRRSTPKERHSAWCQFRSARCSNGGWKAYQHSRCEGRIECSRYDREDWPGFIRNPECAQMGFFSYLWFERYGLSKDSVNFYLRTLDLNAMCMEEGIW